MQPDQRAEQERTRVTCSESCECDHGQYDHHNGRWPVGPLGGCAVKGCDCTSFRRSQCNCPEGKHA